MTVQALTEVLAALPFNSHEEAKVVLYPGVQAFLIRATKAAAADHLNAKVRHLWRDERSPLPAAHSQFYGIEANRHGA
jgi:hypothetical protein